MIYDMIAGVFMAYGLGVCRIALVLARASWTFSRMSTRLFHHARGAQTWYQATLIAKADDARAKGSR